VATNKQERAFRAQELLNSTLLQDVLATMREQAITEYMVASKWWWGDRRRRIAAEHLREVYDFGRRLELIAKSAPRESITVI
jgi:hypothetical protein